MIRASISTAVYPKGHRASSAPNREFTLTGTTSSTASVEIFATVADGTQPEDIGPATVSPDRT